MAGELYHPGQLMNNDVYQGQPVGNTSDIYHPVAKDLNNIESLIPNI